MELKCFLADVVVALPEAIELGSTEREVLIALASIGPVLFQRVDRLLEEPRAGESMKWNQYIFELSRA